MRPRLSYRDRVYLAILVADGLALIGTARFWWRSGT